MRISFIGLLQCCTSIKIAELPKWVQIPPKVTKQGKSSQKTSDHQVLVVRPWMPDLIIEIFLKSKVLVSRLDKKAYAHPKSRIKSMNLKIVFP